MHLSLFITSELTTALASGRDNLPGLMLPMPVRDWSMLGFYPEVECL